jgi:O-acetyl-ADP-ribose deacetylase (regulator of RNase III)
VAVPAVSAGVYGWAPEQVARIAVDAVRAWDRARPGVVDEVTFVLFTPEVQDVFVAALEG